MRTLADGLPDAIPGDVRRAFSRIDENKSGQLDHTELRAALHDLGLRNNTGEAVRLLHEDSIPTLGLDPNPSPSPSPTPTPPQVRLLQEYSIPNPTKP